MLQDARIGSCDSSVSKGVDCLPNVGMCVQNRVSTLLSQRWSREKVLWTAWFPVRRSRQITWHFATMLTTCMLSRSQEKSHAIPTAKLWYFRPQPFDSWSLAFLKTFARQEQDIVFAVLLPIKDKQWPKLKRFSNFSSPAFCESFSVLFGFSPPNRPWGGAVWVHGAWRADGCRWRPG